MPLLLFVSSILMLLTITTYAQLEGYRNSMIAYSQFDRFTNKKERAKINDKAEKIYDAIHIFVSDGKGHNTPAAAIRKLTIAPLFDRDDPARKELLVRLLTTTYGNYGFFPEALVHRPTLFDQIATQLITAGRDKRKKIELAHITFDDEETKTLYARMVAGDGDHLPQLSSLIETQSKNPIRLYLAHRPLLIAIFGDSTTVDTIFDRRRALFQNVNNGQMSKEKASALFKAEIKELLPPQYPLDLFNFKVTKSWPPANEQRQSPTSY